MKTRTCIGMLLLLAGAVPALAFPAAGPSISRVDIGGTVQGDHGPETGVWVIAETTDLPTKYAKIVVTDDQGRFVIPSLPKASYRVWVRGYGLVDSPKVSARPGKLVNLKAVTAPDERAAAAYYPGMYWYSLIDVPKPEDFVAGAPGNAGMAPTMKSQAAWVDTMKNMCQSCHALGSKGIREVPETFARLGDSFTAWAHRTQAGQAMPYMAIVLGSMGPEKALAMYANWTDRIRQGELPFAKPSRPEGIERNVVYTVWDWASPKHYQHDAISTDKRNPRINANGLIWGSSEESTDLVPTLDPVRNIAAEVRHPYRDPKTPSSLDLPHGNSAYWGMEPIWDGHTSIHNVMMDEAKRIWFTARIRPEQNPAFCRKGSTHPSAMVVPLDGSVRQLSVYDPATKTWNLIDTCFTTHHLYFGHDENNTLWTSSGSPAGGVVGWLNTKMYLQTHDEQKSQGWTPLIIDTNGNGKRDDYVEANQPLDPSKDKRVMAAFYGIMPSPVDNSIWGQSMDRGFSRMDQPGYIVRLDPGPDPARTALAEIYQPPEGTFGARGIDIDLNGVVWTALSSGHIASFDRRLCKGPLNGPGAAEGKQCPEGWKLYQMPGPQFRNLDAQGSANHAYYVWVDRYNAFGLGANVAIASANGGEALIAVVDDKLINLRMPYPLGFFTKNVDGRIDDPLAGWKGRGLWTTSGTRASFHNEGGVENSPKVYKVQMRPDPLAR
ncbi:carboxypeptidase-like regulatory domain-containing protein [Noviherbaspirillum pedocola]|uniref:Carboxypeptidase regulatory-like domain-containing protein n=1 Tax=Noviherbaspirillum pedocola TaxID=2801341 RepID=A0A934SYT5_9BURK|nr:carboxypeptidase-like regulatory domain-containing protein [Noviherbaspirillum pedocola]MBK4735164.1 carboxypeptidase regulatory-like domain-containing protein [Noviherbaspirillum pedocola]